MCKEAKTSSGRALPPFGSGVEPLDERPWNDPEVDGRGTFLSEFTGRFDGIGIGLDAVG